MVKFQAPTTNIQRNPKYQIPKKSQTQIPKECSALFGAWSLLFLWSLDVGAWIFVPQTTVKFQAATINIQRNPKYQIPNNSCLGLGVCCFSGAGCWCLDLRTSALFL